MSDTIWWCVVHDAQDAGTSANPLSYCWHGFYLSGDAAKGTVACRMVERRLVSADALVVEREDGEWPASCLSRIKESYEDLDTPSELLDALLLPRSRPNEL